MKLEHKFTHQPFPDFSKLFLLAAFGKEIDGKHQNPW